MITMRDIPSLNERWLNTINTHALPITSEPEVSHLFNYSVLDGDPRHFRWTSSGTSAYGAILDTLFYSGKVKGTEVIMCPYTWKSILLMNLDRFQNVSLVEWTDEVQPYIDAVTPKTEMVLITHLFGKPFNVVALREGLNRIGRQDIIIVEDACQAHGANYWTEDISQGKQFAGCVGDFGFFSFYQTKNIFSGEGGLVVTKNNHYSQLLTDFINPANNYQFPSYENRRPHPSIFSKILPQIHEYDSVVQKRNKIAESYRAALELDKQPPHIVNVWHQFPFPLPADHFYHDESPHYYVQNKILWTAKGNVVESDNLRYQWPVLSDVTFFPIHQIMSERDAVRFVEWIDE